MKIIVRNRNKNIEVNNITSKEEMVWVAPEQFTAITTDAATVATEFMKKHPQIHEVKFSVLPQMDDEEDEEQFRAEPVSKEEGMRVTMRGPEGNVVYDNREEQQKARVFIIHEDELQEELDFYAVHHPNDHWTMEQLKNNLSAASCAEGETFGHSVSMEDPDICHTFKCLCQTSEVVVYEYQGTSKC